MKCLLRYQWVKLRRDMLPDGKGIMGSWAKLAARAAFRKGRACYCGHTNDVTPGMWAGGVVGLKSILGIKKRGKVLDTLKELSGLGYIRYTLDNKTKKLTYELNDWVLECCGAECMDGAVYTTEGYGFLCLPRTVTERLVKQNRVFGEADAWLDLWCHTAFQEPDNRFSFEAPVVQYGKYGAALSLEMLGKRWRWEKTKVWRFFHKYSDIFALEKLPGAFGCLIFNLQYPTGTDFTAPESAEIVRILSEIRILAGNAHISGTDRERLNKMITWYSRQLQPEAGKADNGEPENAKNGVPYGVGTDDTARDGGNCGAALPGMPGGGLPEESQGMFGTDAWRTFASDMAEDRVALRIPIIRAYFSLCRKCKNCIYDCRGRYTGVDDNLRQKETTGRAETGRTAYGTGMDAARRLE